MSMATHGWKAMPEGREKYQAYLCSREWSKIRERVRSRSGGVCERCLTNEMDHVHHLTYERKYQERMEDLQAICKPCHDFTHAKSDFDPMRTRPVFVAGRAVRSFYLAGKITRSPWRDEIVGGWSYQNHSRNYRRSGVSDSDGEEWLPVPSASESVDGVFLDYLGPWWCAEDTGGHSSLSDSDSPHAYGRVQYDNHGCEIGVCEDQVASARNTIRSLIRKAVEESDLVFAWIESNDCLGTMLEIGMASSMGIPVVVASPTGFDCNETWLARSFADFRVFSDSAGEAWRHFWKNLVETNPNHPIISSRRIK